MAFRARLHRSCPVTSLVADITYVATWSGFVYLAFVADLFSRRIVGLARLDQPAGRPRPRRLGARRLAARPRGRGLAGLIHHSDRRVQQLAIRYTERLADIGAIGSVGSVGDFYDIAA